jgi:5'-nucleotidase/UDP-sugar diphosphatase
MMEHVKPFRFRLILGILLTASIFAQEKRLYILHTNNTNGALENCYCPDHPFGAVEKRTIFINDFISAHPNSILVDAGDIFTMTHQPFKDSLMAEAYSLLPYDAILPGDQELTMKPEQVAGLLNIMNINVVGTNITLDGVDKFVTSKIIKRDGIKVAIMGIMDPYAVKYYTSEQKDHIVLGNPVEAIKEEMEILAEVADIFILLTHQGADLDYALAEKIDGLDVIVGSHSQSPIDKPEEVNGTLIVQAGKEGYYVGIAELIINGRNIVSKSGRIDTMKFGMPDDERVMKFIHDYEDKSGRINRQKLKEKK